MRKKICIIAESFGSGVFSFLVDLVNGIYNEFDIIIAYGEREETPKNFKDYFNKNVRFIKVENFTRNINLKKDIKALKEIKTIIKQNNPDIVHLHSSKAGVLGRIAVNGKKIKMFYNPHGFSFLKKDDSKLKRIIYWTIEKMMAILNNKCIIIGCSKGEYKEAKKLNKNSICINNGIDIKKLNRETEGFIEKEIDYTDLKICTVGRIGYQKNPELFNKIAETFPKFQFTWIGDGELKCKLTNSNIEITGWKSREDVLKILNEQDIFVLTSLWEGLPLSLLEAMYMKKICIVSDCIGNRDVIIDGTNGFIAKDLKEYIDNLQKILNGKYKEISENAYKDVINQYNLSRMIEEYKQGYKKI